MKRNLITGETKRVAAFLAKLVRRNDKKQKALIKALEGLAKGRIVDLSVFDVWAKEPYGLAQCCGRAMRELTSTKSYVLQACNLCSGKKAKVSTRAKLAEVLFQRRDLIDTLIW